MKNTFSNITIISLTVIMLLGFTGCIEASKPAVKEQYTADWASLANHEKSPEWFKDAKIGIYFHWGVYSVPAYSSEWYPSRMHLTSQQNKKGILDYHIKTYGQPTEFGYHDFVPMFKARNFDADEWAELFKKAGAKFAGPVAEHHDGFSMWDSEVTPWNAMDKGPKRDITGELSKAIKKRGMKFITTFHHARNNLWKNDKGKWVGHYNGIMKNFPSLLDDPENAILYGYMPREEFVKMWYAKLVEVIDNYQPDIMWFDSWLQEIPEQARQEFCTYYLNQAQSWDKEVVICRKQDDLPINFTVDDLEKSRMEKLTDDVWMTDDTISKGSWCYTTNLTIKPTRDVLHSMIDIISKNGILLLNVSPLASGTIPENQKQVLTEFGDWLQVNGEAIYYTRPWTTYGQGPTKEPRGHFSSREAFLKLKYTAEDIRFTQSKDGKTLYVICMDWPEKPFTVKSVKMPSEYKLPKVKLLGSRAKVQAATNMDRTITITPPNLSVDKLPCKDAYVFKVTGF